MNTEFKSPTATDARHWTNPTNVFASDDSKANTNNNSDYEIYKDFGFDLDNVGTIDGIEVVIEGRANAVDFSPVDISLSWDKGASFSDVKSASFETDPDQTRTLGGSTDTWGRTWRMQDFSNNNFRLRAEQQLGNTRDVLVDHIKIKIYFTLGISKNDQTPTTPSGDASPDALLKKRYIFLSETDAGEQKDMTESWDFDSIIREINGSATVTITTDKTSDTFNDGSTDLNNAITIRVATGTTGTEGLDYFTGYIAQRTLVIDEGTEKVVLRCFGHISKLYQAIWRDGTTIVHNFTGGDSASNIAKEIIDKYRALDSNMRVNYSATSVENSGTTVKDKFEAITFGVGLDRAISLAHTTDRIWIWRVLGDNIFTMKKIAEGGEHQIIMGRDVVSLRLKDDLINSANEVFTYFNNTATRRVSNSDNIGVNGYISELLRETNVTDSTTADEIGNAILTGKLPSLLKLTITVSEKYLPGIETINPGDTCEILGVPEQIRDTLSNNMIINKTIYRKDEVELELSIRHPLLESEVENIRRKFIESRTEGIPNSYTDV